MSFGNYRQCKFCSQSYFYTAAYITHLRDRHGKRIKCFDTTLDPNEGFPFENNYFLLPNITQPAVLPPDSDDDKSNEESGKKNEPSNRENDSVSEENELLNKENDLQDKEDEFADSDNGSRQSIAALEDSLAMILDTRFEMLSDHEPGKVNNEEANRLDEQFDQPDNWAPFDNEEEY